MPWATFEKASQAVPGAKMRHRWRTPIAGRPHEYRVVKRENHKIYFDNGSYLSIADAKREYEVKV